MPTLPLAEGLGAEGIIWLIILFFWGIAQFVQKIRRSSRPSGAPPSRRPPPPLNDEVREMLEQLAGRSSARPPIRSTTTVLDDDEEDVWIEKPAPQRQQPQRQAARPPNTARPQTQPAPIRAQKVAPARDIHAPPPGITDMASMRLAEDPISALGASSGGLTAYGQSLRMKGTGLQGLVAMPSSGSHRRHGPALLSLRELTDTATLRRAVLTKIILDPPRGIVPYGHER